MRDKNEIKINIIRHGKTALNEKHCYIGITDEPLSENGRLEIIQKKEKGIYEDTKVVFVSPMIRAKETANIIFPSSIMLEIPEFREMDFADFEGKNYEQLKDNLHYRRWIDESRGIGTAELKELYGDLSLDVSLPESKEAFTNRVKEGFLKVIGIIDKMMLEGNIRKTDSISIVAHGGTLMAIVNAFSNEDFYQKMVSCGDGIETKVVYNNDNGNIKISRFSSNNRICC